MKISKAAANLIIEQEVSSKAIYIKKYQRPEWPGASSGVTVGIGYDLGQASPQKIEDDWKGIVDDDMLQVMIGCSGYTGSRGSLKTEQVKNKILITWDQAIKVFEEKDMPSWEAKVAKILPNTNLLTPDQFGVLVSLSYNRGLSFNNSGDRFTEMRAIKAAMTSKQFDKIPAQLRKMKRLWPNLRGLINRREAEAKLFESSFKSSKTIGNEEE